VSEFTATKSSQQGRKSGKYQGPGLLNVRVIDRAGGGGPWITGARGC